MRSDDVVLIAECVDAPTRRFIDRFAIEYRQREASEADLDGATAVLMAIGDVARENPMVRGARRHGIPVHVDNRQLVSDFTMLELVERAPASFARRAPTAVVS